MVASFLSGSGLAIVLVVLGACGPAVDTASLSPIVSLSGGDGLLDCEDGQVVRDAGIVVSGESEQSAVSEALAEWTDKGAVIVAIPQDESWSASLDGRDVAIAVPEIEGTGRWVVHDVRTCGAPHEGTAAIDGHLDCANDVEISMQGIFLPDARGLATPEEELQEFLSQWRSKYGGDIVLVDRKGSLVVDGREQVVAIPSEAPAGGWLVSTTLYCEGFGL